MSKDKKPRVRAFTLIELLVVIAVISILVAILFPVYASMREKGQRTACTSNMRQIEMALTAYTQDNEGQFPVGNLFQKDWSLEVFPYAKSQELFQCPTVQIPFPASLPSPFSTTKGYALNKGLNTWDYSDPNFIVETGLALARVKSPATTVALAESGYGSKIYGHNITGPLIEYLNSNTLAAPESLVSLAPGETWIGPPGGLRHNGGCNYAFVDGHVHWYTPTQVLNSTKANDGTQPSFAL